MTFDAEGVIGLTFDFLLKICLSILCLDHEARILRDVRIGPKKKIARFLNFRPGLSESIKICIPISETKKVFQ